MPAGQASGSSHAIAVFGDSHPGGSSYLHFMFLRGLTFKGVGSLETRSISAPNSIPSIARSHIAEKNSEGITTGPG